ncbi:hypothetical protein NADFUDRAFT_64941 [Nadsonia fulvescens var. elongata DSM 6958]|uniref:Wings apart-like protein C-terminal domain-containing protein n=1 Tax=Nadsonia fulvescens var. elongata DSM 6958 TaxID=857566 RepID=A0A1E3PLR0_9ASCO|nr:hypothetical protein NADFUDRAFT_64941 [Nadsonia fulvescens var. elongata DSM 6958]
MKEKSIMNPVYSSPLSSPPSSPLSPPPTWLILPDPPTDPQPSVSPSVSSKNSYSKPPNFSTPLIPILGRRRVLTYGKKRSVRPIVSLTSADLVHFREQPKLVDVKKTEINGALEFTNQVELSEKYKAEGINVSQFNEAVESQIEGQVAELIKSKTMELEEPVEEPYKSRATIAPVIETSLEGMCNTNNPKLVQNQIPSNSNPHNDEQLDSKKDVPRSKIRTPDIISKQSIPSSPTSTSSSVISSKRVKFNPPSTRLPTRQNPEIPQSALASSPPPRNNAILSSFETAAWDFLSEEINLVQESSLTKGTKKSKAKILHSWSSQLNLPALNDEDDSSTDNDDDNKIINFQKMNIPESTSNSDDESHGSSRLNDITIQRTTITSSLKNTYGSMTRSYLNNDTKSTKIGEGYNNDNIIKSSRIGFQGSSSPTKAACDLTDADLDAIFGTFDNSRGKLSSCSKIACNSPSGDSDNDNGNGDYSDGDCSRDNQAVKTIHDLRHAGQRAQFDDDARYLLDGLAGSNLTGKTRCSSLLDFATRIAEDDDGGFINHFTLPKSGYLEDFFQLTMTVEGTDADGVGRFLTGLILLRILMSPYGHHLTSLLTSSLLDSTSYRFVSFLVALLQDATDVRTMAENASMAKRTRILLQGVLAKFNLLQDDYIHQLLNGEMLALTILTAFIDKDAHSDHLLRNNWCTVTKSMEEPLLVVALKSFKICIIQSDSGLDSDLNSLSTFSFSRRVTEDWQRLHMAILLLEFMSDSSSFRAHLFSFPRSVVNIFKYSCSLLDYDPFDGHIEGGCGEWDPTIVHDASERVLAPLFRLLILLTSPDSSNESEVGIEDHVMKPLVVAVVGILALKYGEISLNHKSDVDICLFALGLLVNLTDRVDFSTRDMVTAGLELHKLFILSSKSEIIRDENSKYVHGYLSLALVGFCQSRPELLNSSEMEQVKASLELFRESLSCEGENSNYSGLKDRVVTALEVLSDL